MLSERITNLACSVNNVAVVFNPLEVNGLREGALYYGEIRVDEVVLDELNDEGGFA